MRCIADIFADDHVTPRTRDATASVSNPAASAAYTTSVPTLVPTPVHHVWKRVHGGANITSVQWPVDRYVGLTGHRFVVAEAYPQICARLPCDEPCPELLDCDHPCPSGELREPVLFRDSTEPRMQSAVNLANFRSASSA